VATYQLIVIGVGLAVVVLTWLVLRFGRQIARALFVGGILVAVALGAGALLIQAAANRATAQAALEAAKVAKSASVGQSISTVMMALVLGVLGTVAAGALGAAGFFALRWKLEQRKRQAAALPGQRHRRLPSEAQPGQVIYIVDEADPLPIDARTLEDWGW
jgi:hypothetical protein